MSKIVLHPIEGKKIDCVPRFFAEINQRLEAKKVKYEVVNGYAKLMDFVG